MISLLEVMSGEGLLYYYDLKFITHHTMRELNSLRPKNMTLFIDKKRNMEDGELTCNIDGERQG